MCLNAPQPSNGVVERNFILALSGDEVGAGLVELDDLPYLGWFPHMMNCPRY